MSIQAASSSSKTARIGSTMPFTLMETRTLPSDAEIDPTRTRASDEQIRFAVPTTQSKVLNTGSRDRKG